VTAESLSRSHVARVLVDWSGRARRPLVVGNGFLARDVVAAGDGDHVIYLLAGMGLAPAVAAGIAQATGSPTVALEGDGNHLMGLPATATIGLQRFPVTHVVYWNGGWESTGGQRIYGVGEVHDVGLALGYEWAKVVRDEAELRDALDRASCSDAPVLVHAVGAMGEPPAARSTATMSDIARRFERWASVALPRTARPMEAMTK
jgi:hypothetical protein